MSQLGRDHPLMHERADFDSAMALIGSGATDAEIARRTGVPRRTVNRWRHRSIDARPSPRRRRVAEHVAWRPPDRGAYSYLLGMYLGDGCVARVKNSALLQIVLDRRYEGVIQECTRAIERTLPGVAANRYPKGSGGAIAVQASSALWPTLFPQHGAGRKHLRRIELVEWQLEITRRHPRELVRGLIHSDGCRTVNRFAVNLPSGRVGRYEYPRYFFSNLSADIRGIFCDHCDLLGIRWTRSNPRNISVSHRASVAMLDSFVGPKT